MKDQPLVSVIVINYNYGQFLEESINSALNQGYPHTEVVVVDDGSTDNSQEIIASYGDRILPVFKENGGMASAYNAGFAASRGEIVIFLDADDYLFPCTAERVVAAWEPDVVKVHYRLQKVDALGNPLGELYPPQHKSLDSGVVWSILLEKVDYVTCTASGNGLSRGVLDQILPVPEAEFKNWADTYLIYSVPFHGKIGSIDEALGGYRIHGSNIWALTELSSDRFRTLVRIRSQIHALLVRKANEMGYKVPRDLDLCDHQLWSFRLVSLRLDPQNHPVPSDESLRLIYSGLRSIWQCSEFNWKQRLLLTSWFVWVGLLPLPVARPAITLVFLPQSRPRVIDWLIRNIRSRQTLSSTKA